MIVFVNGTPTELREGALVSDAVVATDADPAGRGIAVALNGTVVPRRTWNTSTLVAGDKVEVLTAVAGG